MAPQQQSSKKLHFFGSFPSKRNYYGILRRGYELAQLQGLGQSKNADPAAAAACAAGAFSKPTDDLENGGNFLGFPVDAESNPSGFNNGRYFEDVKI